jgi:hypothetical protein
MTADRDPKNPKLADDASTPASVARQALDDAVGDLVKATDIMVSAVRANPSLYRALMDPLVKNACYVEIRKECRRQLRPPLAHTSSPRVRRAPNEMETAPETLRPNPGPQSNINERRGSKLKLD